MMKNQKGITLMILVATVVVMAIVAGTITYNSMAAIKVRAYYNMCADIELLDEKIALYYLESGELPITTETGRIENMIDDYGDGNENYNPNNSGELYKIDLTETELKNLSLNNEDYFIDEQSHTIYFSYGVTLDDYTYYTVPLDYQEVNLSSYQ